MKIRWVKEAGLELAIAETGDRFRIWEAVGLCIVNVLMNEKHIKTTLLKGCFSCESAICEQATAIGTRLNH